jgi:hypothetical protein
VRRSSIAACLGLAALAAAEPPAEAHWLLVVSLAGEHLRLDHQQRVEAPLPKRRGKDTPPGLRLEVRDRRGVSLFRAAVLDPRTVHLSYRDATGKTRHAAVPAPSPAFVVRLPILPDARRLELFDADGKRLATIDLDRRGLR